MNVTAAMAAIRTANILLRMGFNPYRSAVP